MATQPIEMKEKPTATPESETDLGIVSFHLDAQRTVSAKGIVYGLSYRVSESGFEAEVFLDHYNRRILVNDFTAEDLSAFADFVLATEKSNGYEKASIRSTEQHDSGLLSLGFKPEGTIPGYFRGAKAFVLSHFSSIGREMSERLAEENRIIDELEELAVTKEFRPLAPEIKLIDATTRDIPQMVSIFKQVFSTYPSPVMYPEYLKASIATDSIYIVAEKNGEVLAVAGAEIDTKNANAEMTDCATLPEARGKGLNKQILLALEDRLRTKGILTAYTLCRAINAPMNRVFRQLGYEYSGRMINNCNISGQFEDMNIWAKGLE
jgi:beta-lysine N6-acetyltransferase